MNEWTKHNLIMHTKKTNRKWRNIVNRSSWKCQSLWRLPLTVGLLLEAKFHQWNVIWILYSSSVYLLHIAFSRLVGQLIALTWKYARFKWTEDCQWAFHCLKEQLTAIPLLSFLDLSWPMIFYTDASNKCIGVVLTLPCLGKDEPMPNITEEVPCISYRRGSQRPSRGGQ